MGSSCPVPVLCRNHWNTSLGWLSEKISEGLQAISNEATLPLFIYWYSSILNFFVPSGGALFGIEAPYLAEAAKEPRFLTGSSSDCLHVG
ncbi:TIGR00366 family protein [Paenarthrobacter sp. NPDC089675]|uniref:TIGR00366 family protein n=1 Tax=Paenarthrobacter sp. NPDC089675 TaxID=3364376 RepID=UPI003830DB42